jgi:glycosyltransferase involved in cell wall biosynthesis
MRVVVCTVVHHPADARILHREIRALLDAGHDVLYIAPFRACDVAPWPEVRAVDVPRAVGRRRLAALRAARKQLARYAPGADLVLVHDPEMLLVLPTIPHRPPTVWDVHEDTAAALDTKAWLPPALRRLAASGVLRAEGLAERHLHLLMAETSYNERFADVHPVVPNTTYVPDQAAPYDGQARVVYVGHMSPDRGAAEMVALAELVHPQGITVELVGSADAQARALIEPARDRGILRWHGYTPNDEAMLITDGALAGLSLLQDDPNLRHSMPTKVAEYMARGVPVVTTPLPLAANLVERSQCGFIVPFNDAKAASEAVLTLRSDRALRDAMGARGHQDAAQFLRWPEDARAFVAQLERWAGVAAGRESPTPVTVTSPVSGPDDR